MEKIIVELEAKTDKALKGIDSVAKSVQDLNKEVVNSNKDTAKSLKNVETSSGQAAKGIRGIGNALKAAGIGLAIAAFATLKDIFMQNQKAADFFNTSFEVVSIAFNDFVGFVIDNGTKVTDFFKAIFDDPLESVKELGASIKENIVERFESFLDTLGYLASAVKKVFSGDFAGALEDVKSAGKESLDVLTGVNDTFDKSVDIVNSSADAISNYASETIKAAKGNVELAKSAELAAVLNQGLVEKYDRQAEQLRQIRDDESKSIEDRIKANEELALVLDEQEKAMKENAAIAVASAAAELSKNKDNIELQKAYQEALNEQAAIEAQITGFRSEQQTNTNSLLKEQKEIMNEIALFGKSERDKERLELEQQYNLNKELIEKEITDDAEKKERLLALQKDYNAQLKEVNDGFAQEDLEKKKEIADKEAEIELQKVAIKQNTLDNVISIANAESAVGKAALIAKHLLMAKELILEIKKTITFSTQAAARSTVAMAEGSAQTAKIGFPQNIPMLIGYAAQAAGIFSAIRSAVRSSKAGATIPNITPPPTPTAPSTPPQFNIVGQSGTNQLASAIGGQSQQPIQAYVVANDVTTAQSMDRNIIDDASIGG
tara:strand:+ start:5645 stop:7459 length:1815 start_codon:yes stop_codon:yes gene_type:complete